TKPLPDLLRGPATPNPSECGPVPAASSQQHWPERGGRNGYSPVHGQSRGQADDCPLPRVESAAHDSRRGSQTCLHRRRDRAGHAIPAVRLSPDSIVRFQPKTRMRILVLLTQQLMPPESIPDGVEKEKQPWRTEYDVITALKSMGHEVYPVGLD